MISPLKFVLVGLRRRFLRNLVTVTGVAVAVAALFSLVSFERGYQAGLREELDHLGAHLLVVPKGCPYDAASIALHGASWPCYLKSVYLDTIRRTPHVAVAAPVFMTAVYDSVSSSQSVYCGVEKDILEVKKSWRLDGKFPSATGELLIGSGLAQTKGWTIGNTVILPGIADKRGTVSGILKPTGGPDDLFCFMPIADAQKMFNKPDQLTHALVRLDAPENMNEVVGNLRGCDAGLEMNVVPLAHLFQTIENLIRSTRLLLACVALAALLAACAGLINTVLMAVFERTREIGVLRAIGASQSGIFGLVWTETVALCLTGAVMGIGGAIAATRLIESWLRGRLPFVPEGNLIRPEVLVIFATLGAALILGSISGLIPAWRASRLSPADAIRTSGARG